MQKLIVKNVFVLFFIFGRCGSDFDLNQKNEKLFTRIPTNYSGLTFENRVEQTRENNHLLNVEFVSGAGVAVGDINNDGLPDVYFAGNQVSDKLYLNKGNFKFEDISKKAGISVDTKWSTGVTFVDIDNDGDQDIYVCRFVYLENEKSANQLYINNGDLTFTEQAEAFGLADQGFTTSATFCDFDKDDFIDVYLTNQPPSIQGRRGKISSQELPGILFSDRLYKNTGSGKFIDITDKANVRNFGFGLSAIVGDFNNDTWQDIYVSNDFDVPDYMYINQHDGTFTDIILQSAKHITHFSMGSDVADFDNDGNLDLMVVDMVPEEYERRKTHMTSIIPEEFWSTVESGGHYQYMINTLQRNNGNDTFSDLAQLAGVSRTGWSWGPLFADFDNDGLKDIFISNGVIRNNLHSDLAGLYEQKLDSLIKIANQRNIDPKQLIDVFDFVDLAASDKLPNYIFKNNGDYTFSNKIKDWGMQLPTTSNGAAYADFDLDGDLDLIINNVNESALLYKNNAIENELGNFLRLKLVPSKNQNIYGTKVTLYDNDSLSQVYQVINTRGFRSKSEDVVHFGIGGKTEVDKIIVEWQDNTVNVLEHLPANQLLEVYQDHSVYEEKIAEIIEKPTLFKDVTNELNLSHVRHIENGYNDYALQPLLPYKISYTGPCIGVGDVNGDNREDFYFGGSAGYPGTLYIQNLEGSFDEIKEGAWSEDKSSEDTDVVFVDIDNDRDLDMIVASGGYEFKSDDISLSDRLYINNGHGKFTKKFNGIPVDLTSSSCVVPNDFDGDGDVDLFIGGRLIPGEYPRPADSHLLENKGGILTEVTMEKAPELYNLGLVTAADWWDYNNDGLSDLVIVGEWMPITFFIQFPDGTFKKEIKDGLAESEGWYYEVKTEDMDGDGDEDLLVGNLSLNNPYNISPAKPLELYSFDFDRNGSLDIVMSYNVNGIGYPIEGRENSIRQVPGLEKRYPTFESFSQANLDDIYGESLKKAWKLKAKTFSSAYIENLGDETFKIRTLPGLAQASVINGILVKDFDFDGFKDLLIAGNLFQARIENPRMDAGTGLFLKGNGNGKFTPVSILESDFFTPYDVKEMKLIHVGDREIILVGNNNYYIQAIEYIPAMNKQIVSFKVN